MKVFVDPIPDLSIAMWRVARALRENAPDWVSVVDDPLDADIQVMHVIGPDFTDHLKAPEYAMIQYCYKMLCGDTGANVPVDHNPYADHWENRAVWSYYDLPVPDSCKFMLAPLGVSSDFWTDDIDSLGRDFQIMTSGYVHGDGAEAIEECHSAANGNKTIHLGPPNVSGMGDFPDSVTLINGVTNRQLSEYYKRCNWVSGLRHGEGFELPVLEGAINGARPIVFDRPETRRWFSDFACFIPECSGSKLVNILSAIFENPDPLPEDERYAVYKSFSWDVPASLFWEKIRKSSTEVVAA